MMWHPPMAIYLLSPTDICDVSWRAEDQHENTLLFI